MNKTSAATFVISRNIQSSMPASEGSTPQHVMAMSNPESPVKPADVVSLATIEIANNRSKTGGTWILIWRAMKTSKLKCRVARMG